jgi:hypothetical protein
MKGVVCNIMRAVVNQRQIYSLNVDLLDRIAVRSSANILAMKPRFLSLILSVSLMSRTLGSRRRLSLVHLMRI